MGLTICHKCGKELKKTRINLDIIFGGKKQTENDRVFCSKECFMQYVQDALNDQKNPAVSVDSCKNHTMVHSSRFFSDSNRDSKLVKKQKEVMTQEDREELLLQIEKLRGRPEITVEVAILQRGLHRLFDEIDSLDEHSDQLDAACYALDEKLMELRAEYETLHDECLSLKQKLYPEV